MFGFVLSLQSLVRDLEFINKIVGGSVPREFIAPVEKGVRERMESGILAGYPH